MHNPEEYIRAPVSYALYLIWKEKKKKKKSINIHKTKITTPILITPFWVDTENSDLKASVST